MLDSICSALCHIFPVCISRKCHIIIRTSTPKGGSDILRFSNSTVCLNHVNFSMISHVIASIQCILLQNIFNIVSKDSCEIMQMRNLTISSLKRMKLNSTQHILVDHGCVLSEILDLLQADHWMRSTFALCIWKISFWEFFQLKKFLFF